MNEQSIGIWSRHTARLNWVKSGISVSLISGFLGCAPGMDPRIPVISNMAPGLQPGIQTDAFGRPIHKPTSTADMPPELAVTSVTHLMTIESDIAGRATPPTYFNLQLLVDAANTIRLVNVHRQGTTRFPLPTNGGPVSAADRARICSENSAESQENCDVDLKQLSKDGIVVERLMGRAGVVLKSSAEIDPATGGNLVLQYIEQADLDDSSKDKISEYPLVLEHRNGQWLLISGQRPEKGPVFWMKLESEFTGLYATGIKSVKVGTSNDNLW